MTKTQWNMRTRDFTERLVRLKHEAGSLGLYRTMHAIDLATRATGYEQADILTASQTHPVLVFVRSLRKRKRGAR